MNAPLGTSLYAANIALESIAQGVMYQLARRSGFVKDDSTIASQRLGIIGDATAPLVLAISIPIAFGKDPDIAQPVEAPESRVLRSWLSAGSRARMLASVSQIPP